MINSHERVLIGEQPYYLHLGGCLEFIKTLPDNSIDAIVSDPPAGIGFMNKDWDKDKGGRDAWVDWMSEIAKECLRVLKPGGHALVWSLPRTSHWTAYAWENGGFEIRDNIIHIFGSGFPKSLDISKAIDKAAGAEREVVGEYQAPDGIKRQPRKSSHFQGDANPNNYDLTAPATEAAKQFEGFGTALKPAHEDWWLLRKPIEKGLTIAENCLRWGTGGLDIDGCRVNLSNDDNDLARINKKDNGLFGVGNNNNNAQQRKENGLPAQGRFPANLIHDGSPEVVALFPETSKAWGTATNSKDAKDKSMFKMGGVNANRYDLGGQSATRFFYCAKASPSERNKGLEGFEAVRVSDGRTDGGVGGENPRNRTNQAKVNHHPTVKPLNLMLYLVKLISKEGDVILDPFVGSGTTLVAAKKLGRRAIGCELEPAYWEISKARVDSVIPDLIDLAEKQAA